MSPAGGRTVGSRLDLSNFDLGGGWRALHLHWQVQLKLVLAATRQRRRHSHFRLPHQRRRLGVQHRQHRAVDAWGGRVLGSSCAEREPQAEGAVGLRVDHKALEHLQREGSWPTVGRSRKAA